MSGNECRCSAEACERFAQRRVAFLDGPVEAVMGGHFAGRLPNRFDRVEFRRVRRQPKQRDAFAIGRQPLFTLRV